MSLHLNEIYNSRPVPEQNIARKVFQRLCDKGAEGVLVRLPTAKEELRGLVEPPPTKEQMDHVLAAFNACGARFLCVGKLVDVSHESLFRVWDRAREGPAPARGYAAYGEILGDLGVA